MIISANKPSAKPARPYFSSGPCVKPRQWHASKIDQSVLGRSHRSHAGVALIQSVTHKIRHCLSVPDDYEVAIVPGSATGAYEMALWNLLGQRPVDVFSWDVFSRKWLYDVRDQLKIAHRSFDVGFGNIPDFFQYNPEHDCCFIWLGTSIGAHIPDTQWIPTRRTGLTICDATSAMFSFAPPWEKLDVTAFSFQKVLGGEAAHGVLVLSPHALTRLRTYIPSWPVPSLLSLAETDPVAGRRIKEGLFKAKSNNTPSLWCIADADYCLDWLQSIGGIEGVFDKVARNYRLLQQWVSRSNWVRFLIAEEHLRSPLAVTLVPTQKQFLSTSQKEQWTKIQQFCAILEKEDAAYDIKGHALATPSLRIWCGPTVEVEDLEALLPWLDYAAEQVGFTR